mgnify:CR=1 FL=1
MSSSKKQNSQRDWNLSNPRGDVRKENCPNIRGVVCLIKLNNKIINCICDEDFYTKCILIKGQTKLG